MAGQQHKGQKLAFDSLEDMAKYIQTPGNVEIIDACFADPMGVWHHCSYTPSVCELKDLKLGFAFDGSSIKLFTTIDKSDMHMMPDPASCWIDPFCKRKTLHVVCFIEDPFGNSFDRCPRGVSMRAVQFVKSIGIADTVYIGPEPEFFIFDDVKYTVSANKCMFEVDGDEGFWRSGLDMPGGNKGHRGGPKASYFPVAPQDKSNDIRSEMLLTMGDVGLPIEKHHHEVAACQHELGIACNDLVTTADNVMTYKYVVKNVAMMNGKTATFMPKPVLGDCGSGMHCHQSLWKDGQNLFYATEGGYFNLSPLAMHYIGGLLKHAPAVLAFTNPTVNSYKRLVPGFEAPANLVFSKGNRSAAIRIPLSGEGNPKAKRLEFRCPDAACCPHLAFAAMLMAGLDGIEKKTEPPKAIECDLYHLSEEEQKQVPSTPARLEDALDALESDHRFLTKGGVFPEEFIRDYIAYKRAECKQVALVPNPKEYELYYRC